MNPENEPRRTSHVTAAPNQAPGHDYDPQIRAQYANEPQVVHAKREVEVPAFEISNAVREKHETSVQQYPHLNLSRGEYVAMSVRRHVIGLIGPILVGGTIMAALLVFLVLYPADTAASGLPDFMLVLMVSALFMLLVGIGTYIAVWVYLQNHFVLTNESVIQEIQTSLFARHEQTVSLGSIEDASFQKHGILQTLFDYGTLRLSTEGEETTYRFYYVSNPRKQIATINNAIEAFKNGRPLESYESLS